MNRRLSARTCYLGLLLLAVALLAVAWSCRQRALVRWSEVLAAVTRQETVNGVGAIHAPDGSEWALTSWVQIAGPATFPARAGLVPVNTKPAQPPSPEAIEAGNMANFLTYSDLPELAARRRATPCRRVDWSGQELLLAEIPPSQGTSGVTWRFYLDPESKLVQGLDLVSSNQLLARISYRYNLPLPKGFTPSR